LQAEAEHLSERLQVPLDEERQRIADELHDSTAQRLLAISLNLTNLKSRTAAEGETRKLFDEIDRSVDEATKELRSYTYLLHPPHLESDGLTATLQWYVDGFGQRTGLRTTMKFSGNNDPLPLRLQRSMLRIVQEALTNVHRHASATRVSVYLRRVERKLDLVIRDDGQGMEGAVALESRQPSKPGVGIPGMTARIQQFGGKIRIRSGPKGTTVHTMVPVGQVCHAPRLRSGLRRRWPGNDRWELLTLRGLGLSRGRLRRNLLRRSTEHQHT
jgi:two-component system NarL family sensor kinase